MEQARHPPQVGTHSIHSVRRESGRPRGVPLLAPDMRCEVL